VVVYDKLTYAGNLDNLKDVAERFAGRYAFVQGDIADEDGVDEVMREHEIDTIVNFAADTHVDRSLMGAGSFIQTDVYGTYVLLEAAKKYEVERYHQVSTDEVYGEIPEGYSSVETDPLHTRSPYSASKAGGDLMCIAYFTSFGVPNAIDDIPLPLYGDGRQMRDYQYVLDHCEGIDVVLHRGQPGEIYNVGTGVETQNIVMAHRILDLLGKPYSLEGPPRSRPPILTQLCKTQSPGLGEPSHLRPGPGKDRALVRG